MVKLAKEMEKNDAEQWERDKERMRRQAREEYGSDDHMVFNRSHRSWKYELEKNNQWKRMK